MLLLQNILYCLLFILMVRNDGMNCVYFYPKEYIEEADKRGLIDKDFRCMWSSDVLSEE